VIYNIGGGFGLPAGWVRFSNLNISPPSLSFALYGLRQVPLAASAGDLDFGAVVVGASQTLTLTLTNPGTAPTTISGFEASAGFS